MNAWELISEEASIVLVGNLNPKIFHPEWFIRKDIVPEWDYSKDEVINLSDMSQMTFPGDSKITVLLNQFSLRSSLASNHLALKDIVTSTFSALRETPITQMGMNYVSVVKIPDKEQWMKFGTELAPHKYWEDAVDFFSDLDSEKKKDLGLWELTMRLPRPDDMYGYIHPKIAAVSLQDQTLSFSVNNHIEIEDGDAMNMVKILEDNWEKSMDFAKNLTNNILMSQLENAK